MRFRLHQSILTCLYWDRPRERWPRTADGGLAMFTAPLDLVGLLKELEGAAETAPASQ